MTDDAAINIPCETGLESAIQAFRTALPGWWFSVCECEVSCDASAAPTRLSEDLALIAKDERFNSGFHVDLTQPSTLADALRCVMEDAVEARARAHGGGE